MEEYDLEDVAKTLTWIFLLFPHFALSHGLTNLNIVSVFDQICDTQCDLILLCMNRFVSFLSINHSPDIMKTFEPGNIYVPLRR